MLALGLLWFDDDSRRPLPQKIAEAVARYEERIGEAPSVCQVSPAQAAALTSARSGQVTRVRIVPDETLRPNYFLVGIEIGEELPGPLPQIDMPIDMPIAETVSAAHARVRAKRRQPTTMLTPPALPVAAAAHARRAGRPRAATAAPKSLPEASEPTASAAPRTPRRGRQATERMQDEPTPQRRRAS